MTIASESCAAIAMNIKDIHSQPGTGEDDG
jgi:hypothetical protein